MKEKAAEVCVEDRNFQYLLEHLTIGGAIAICAICFAVVCIFYCLTRF